jgi:hypothetical protein
MMVGMMKMVMMIIIMMIVIKILMTIMIFTEKTRNNDVKGIILALLTVDE